MLLQCLLGEDYRLNERCSSTRPLWEDSQRDRPFAGAPRRRQNASMGDEAVNQLTEYGYAYFEEMNRYDVAGENGNLKVAFKAPLNVFDDFVRSEHLESGRWAGEAVAKAKEVEHRASQAESHAQLAKLLARQAEERAAEAEATLQEVFSSRSWRVTEPLRWLASIVRPKREKANAIGMKCAGGRAQTSPNWSGTSADSVMLDVRVSGGQECATLRPGLRGINADQRTPLESSFHFYSDKL